MDRTDKIRLICRIAVIGMILALLYHGVARLILHQPYPYNTFLFRQVATFSDFTDFIKPIRSGSPLSVIMSVYFPFTYVTLYPLVWLPPLAGIAVLVLLFGGGLFCFAWSRLGFLEGRARLAAAVTVSFVSYPFLFCVNRANVEMIVFLFLVGFLLLFLRGRYLAAAVLLGGATAMKLYPGLFGLLLLKQRRYGAAAVTAAVTLILTIVPAMAFPGGIRGSVALLQHNLAVASRSFVLGVDGIPFSATYWSAMKAVGGPSMTRWAEVATLPYSILGLIAVAGVSLYVLAVEQVLWKQLALIAFATILIPQISFDYRQIHVLMPLLLFVAAPRDTAEDDRFYATLFALLLIPKAYFATDAAIGIGVVLNPAIMTAIGARIIITGLRSAGPAAPSASMAGPPGAGEPAAEEAPRERRPARS